jgi:hypothetical protein
MNIPAALRQITGREIIAEMPPGNISPHHGHWRPPKQRLPPEPAKYPTAP